MISTFVRHGMEVNRLGEAGYAALHLATKNKSEQVMALIISTGADVNAKTKYEQKSALHVSTHAL